MKQDIYGNAVSTTSSEALDHYNDALLLMRLYWGDPVAALDAALEEDPRFSAAWAMRAALLVQQSDRAYLPEARRSIRSGRESMAADRDAALLSASEHWADGAIRSGVRAFMRVARDNPRDMVALQTAHIGHFYLGQAPDLRDAPLQALRAFLPEDEGYHAVLGMAAFGLEECGDYKRAHDFGTEAVERNPRDAWAVHAVAHVHEMRGDDEAGMTWLRSNAEALSPENGFSYHNWWHLALLHLDREEHDAVLALYDSRIRPDPEKQVLLEWIDASALLWRLHLEGIDSGDRFERLAQCWLRAVDDRHYAFNDLHALMAFLGAGRHADAQRSLAALRTSAAAGGDNGMMARQVGLPLGQAFMDLAEGRHEAATEGILGVRASAHSFGGSHAQRDILTLTAFHAASRGGMAAAAEAIAAERLFHKPASPWARRLSRRAADMRRDGTYAPSPAAAYR